MALVRSVDRPADLNGTRNPARLAKHGTYLRFRLAYVLRLEMVPFLERAFRVPTACQSVASDEKVYCAPKIVTESLTSNFYSVEERHLASQMAQHVFNL